MPKGMSGLEIAEQLRATHPDLPVIVSSGDSAELVRDDRLTALLIHYLPKPSSSAQIAALLRRCLDQAPV